MAYLDDLKLFPRLREAGSQAWSDYVEHEFVSGVADGTLPETAFRQYLGQDYLFLIHFARAYALAAYKAESLAEITRCRGGDERDRRPPKWRFTSPIAGRGDSMRGRWRRCLRQRPPWRIRAMCWRRAGRVICSTSTWRWHPA